MMDQDFPVQGVEMSVLLVVGDLDRARAFYRDVLGATELRQYGGTSAVMQFQGTWLVLVTGGGPTPDKPTIAFRPPTDTHTVSHELTIKVPGLLARLSGAGRARGRVPLASGGVRLGDPLLLS